MLPRTPDEFRQREYWDAFNKAGGGNFEWYGQYPSIRTLFRNSVKSPSDAVLVAGCGNSTLSAEIHADGFADITSFDYSSETIDAMRAKYADGPHAALKWSAMDATKLEGLADSSFKAVVDKGLLDAMYQDASDDDAVDAMFREVRRVLAPSEGVYIIITLAQDKVLAKLLGLADCGFDVHVHRPTDVEQGSAALLPFVFCCHARADATETGSFAAHFATMSSPGKKKGAAGQTDRDGAASLVRDLQSDDFTRHRVTMINPGSAYPLEIFDPTNPGCKDPKYGVTIVDGKGVPKNGMCGVFLVPQGREHEFTFSNEEGQMQLGEQAGFARLIIVSLSRFFDHGTMAGIQRELSPIMMQLAPSKLKSGKRIKSNGDIPFLSSKEQVGARTLVDDRVSGLSGRMVVEDVSIGEDKMRRLVFMSSMNIVQSEVKLVAQKDNSKAGSATATGAPAPSKKKNTKKNKNKKKNTSGGGGGGGGGGEGGEGGEGAESGDSGAGGGGGDEASNEDPTSSSGSSQVDIDDGIQWGYLASDYHINMLAALCFFPSHIPQAAAGASSSSSPASSPSRRLTSVIVGCGGGVFPTFLYRNWPTLLAQTVVELDPDVVAVAHEHFGLPSFKSPEETEAATATRAPPPPLTVLVQDGLEYVSQLAKSCAGPAEDPGSSPSLKVDILMFDVDSKDSGDGMACPPKAFVEPKVLKDAHDALADGGVFVVNLVCRSKPLFQSTVDALDAVFGTVLVLPVTEWQSTLFAFKAGVAPSLPEAVAAASRMVETGKAAARNTWDEDLHDLPERVGKMAAVPKLSAPGAPAGAPAAAPAAVAEEDTYGDALD